MRKNKKINGLAEALYLRLKCDIEALIFWERIYQLFFG